MSEFEKLNVQEEIEQIITRSRHHDEMFFTDSKTAASDILKLLQRKKFIVQSDMHSSFEIYKN